MHGSSTALPRVTRIGLATLRWVVCVSCRSLCTLPRASIIVCSAGRDVDVVRNERAHVRGHIDDQTYHEECRNSRMNAIRVSITVAQVDSQWVGVAVLSVFAACADYPTRMINRLGRDEDRTQTS